MQVVGRLRAPGDGWLCCLRAQARIRAIAIGALLAIACGLAGAGWFARAQAAEPSGGAEPPSASQSEFLTPLEREILEETNLARTRPGEYARILKESRPYYDGRMIRRPGATPVITREGAAALDEAIAFLERAKPLPALRASRGLSAAAAEHLDYLRRTRRVQHAGAAGERVGERANRHGRWGRLVGENIAREPGRARQVVSAWIIDDAVANRGHRDNLFNEEYRFAGIAAQVTGRGLYTFCVATYAARYEESAPAGAASEGATGKAATSTTGMAATGTTGMAATGKDSIPSGHGAAPSTSH